MNTGSGPISSYQIAPNGTLTLVGNTGVSNSGGVGAADASVSPDGRTLYVNESRVDAVGAFAINRRDSPRAPQLARVASGGRCPGWPRDHRLRRLRN